MVGQAGDTLTVRFLEEGGQRPEAVAAWLADFIRRARRSLDLAFYDCRLSDGPAALIREALADRIRAGVAVRLAYDAGDKPQSPAELDSRGADLAPANTHERVEELGLPDAVVRAVRGERALMHHKYVVRDDEAIWTGSLNLTDDSMRRMENTIITLESPALARLYGRDFLQLWSTGSVVDTGAFRTDPTPLQFAGAAARVDVDFSPGQGEAINGWVARRVEQARRRVVICSMLLTSNRLLRALLAQLDRGAVEVSGVYDWTQMEGALDQWRERADLAWKVDAVARIVAEAGLVGKVSTPYRPDAIHDFMHNKTLVVDDVTITGSYNFSHSAQSNAENILVIETTALAEQVVAYTRRLAGRYRGATLTPHPSPVRGRGEPCP